VVECSAGRQTRFPNFALTLRHTFHVDLFQLNLSAYRHEEYLRLILEVKYVNVITTVLRLFFHMIHFLENCNQNFRRQAGCVSVCLPLLESLHVASCGGATIIIFHQQGRETRCRAVGFFGCGGTPKLTSGVQRS
jgi:hypothetical protein